MKDTQLITFEHADFGKIKGFLKNEEPWFLAAQICRMLGIKDASSAVAQVKQRMQVAGVTTPVSNRIALWSGKAKTTALIINEQGLYELVFRSRKQKAIRFTAWVTGEVLPALRKHGEYRMQGKMFRRSLTDAIQASGENERMHGHAYSTYTRLVYKSLGLPPKVDRDALDAETLEKIANRENTVNALLSEGKQYDEIKAVIASWGIIRLDNPVNV